MIRSLQYTWCAAYFSQVKGSLATVTTTCQDNHAVTWHSQPRKGKRALGDVTLAAAVLFTGCSVTQSLRFLNNAGIACFSERSYHRLQKKLLHPTVNKVIKFLYYTASDKQNLLVVNGPLGGCATILLRRHLAGASQSMH